MAHWHRVYVRSFRRTHQQYAFDQERLVRLLRVHAYSFLNLVLLRYWRCIVMYSHGPLFSGSRTLKRLFLALAGRLSHTRFHPPDQPAPAIANGPTEQQVRRSVPAHARLGKPRLADAKKLGRLLRRKQPLKVAVGLGGEQPITL